MIAIINERGAADHFDRFIVLNPTSETAPIYCLYFHTETKSVNKTTKSHQAFVI